MPVWLQKKNKNCFKRYGASLFIYYLSLRICYHHRSLHTEKSNRLSSVTLAHSDEPSYKVWLWKIQPFRRYETGSYCDLETKISTNSVWHYRLCSFTITSSLLQNVQWFRKYCSDKTWTGGQIGLWIDKGILIYPPWREEKGMSQWQNLVHVEDGIMKWSTCTHTLSLSLSFSNDVHVIWLDV